jgi:hypothetical protein
VFSALHQELGAMNDRALDALMGALDDLAHRKAEDPG